MVMDERERKDTYERAMARMSEYIRRNSDGTFMLAINHGEELDIDPVVFADLRRSLEETNKKIRAGELNPKEIQTLR